MTSSSADSPISAGEPSEERRRTLTGGRDLGGQQFWSACYAPFGSMYLDPHGDIRSCCMNSWQRLGTITEHRLRDIWTGDSVQALRASVAAGDLDRGCEICAHQVEVGGVDAAFLRVFDDLHPTDPSPAWPRRLEFALSNTCNLQCQMCNGELSSAIRIHREHRPALPAVYDDRFFADLDEFLPHLERVTFLGGEPFLARESLRVMRRLVDLGLTPDCHVTTNGTLWNDEIERLVRALPMHVAISVDGSTAATTESIHVGTNWDQLVANIERFRRVTAPPGRGSSFAFCLMQQNWHEFGSVLAWADQLDVDVFVNTVDSPGRFSLETLDDGALAEVVRSLQREASRRRTPLGRNRSVWDGQLRSLEGMASQRQGTPVRLGPAAPPATDDAPLATLHTDVNQIVVDVSLTSAGRRDAAALGTLPGRPLRDLQVVLVDSFGSIVGSDLRREPGGREVRTVTFGGRSARGTRVVQLSMTTGRDGGEQWDVSLGTEPAADRPAVAGG